MRISSSSALTWLLLILLSLNLSSCVPIDSVPIDTILAPFSGLVRQRLLYAESRWQGVFLEIAGDGSVQASPFSSSNCVLELRSVRAGETVIQGVATSFFLCVNSAGHLRGQRHYTEEDCTFRELLVDSYTLFLSPHTNLPISLHYRHSGKKRGSFLSRFLPVLNTQFTRVEQQKLNIWGAELDADDASEFGLASQRHSIFSPSMHKKKKRRGLH